MIIAVVNQKGGVGKTTTSVSIAAYLALKGKKTLLLDLDAQGNATSGLGYEKSIIKKSIYDVLVSEMPISEVIKETERKNLDLCPSNINLAAADVELASAENRSERLKEALKKIKKKYDYIIIDCPPSLGVLTINALVAAKKIIIPIQAEYYALEGVTALMDSYQRIKDHLNPKLDIMGVVMTMVDSRTQLSKQVTDEVSRFFGDVLFKTLIPRNVRLSEAPGFGKTINEYDRFSKGGRAYQKLVKEIIERSEQ